jgi:hypothetical protein
MRLLRVVLVALFGVFAVIVGLITAAVVSLATGLVLMLRRAVVPSHRGGLHRREPQRFSKPKPGEIIEVTATEIPADSAPR